MREDVYLEDLRRARKAIAQTRAMRVNLRQTIYAVKHNRRTPAQIHDLCTRCEGLRRRVQVLRLSHSHLHSFH